jgi:hypothetical protein
MDEILYSDAVFLSRQNVLTLFSCLESFPSCFCLFEIYVRKAFGVEIRIVGDSSQDKR